MSGQDPACLQYTCEWAARALLAEQLLLPLPNPTLLAGEIWGGHWSAQEQPALAVEIHCQGGAGCKNNAVRAGLLEAENHWREQGEHLATTRCYSITVGPFPEPPRRDPERNYLKMWGAPAGCGQPWLRETLWFLERGSAWRTGPPRLGAAVWGPHRNSFKRGAEVWLKSQQGPGAHVHACTAALTKRIQIE